MWCDYDQLLNLYEDVNEALLLLLALAGDLLAVACIPVVVGALVALVEALLDL